MANLPTEGLLRVRVTDDLTLDAGTWDLTVAEDQRPIATIDPSATPMFRQIVEYLEARPVPPGGNMRRAEEARAAVAVCLRWGSYFALLADPSLPATPDIDNGQVSQIADDEMARMNVEISAALAWWLTLRGQDDQALLGSRASCPDIPCHGTEDRPTAALRRPALGMCDAGDGGSRPQCVGCRAAGTGLGDGRTPRHPHHRQHNHPARLAQWPRRGCPCRARRRLRAGRASGDAEGREGDSPPGSERLQHRAQGCGLLEVRQRVASARRACATVPTQPGQPIPMVPRGSEPRRRTSASPGGPVGRHFPVDHVALFARKFLRGAVCHPDPAW